MSRSAGRQGANCARPQRRCGRALRSAALLLCFGVAWQTSTAATTAELRAHASADREQFAGPVNPIELRAFIAGVWAQQQVSAPMAGAVVTVVRGGRVYLNQGLGYADRERRVEVNPERTLFRLGSISKVFVYLALQQQIAAGRLGLDSKVTAVLPGLSIDHGPAAGSGPLLLRHLVTHSAGLDEQVIGLFARDPAQVRPLHELLTRDPPLRLRPPGQDSSYSNYGVAVAARMVEAVSGQNYPAYLQRQVLTPLQLLRTTTVQPPAAIGAVDAAIGYRNVGGQLRARAPEVVPMMAVGGMSSTGGDMARLMIELLRPSGAALPAERVLALRERLFVSDPRLPAVLFGLYEQSVSPRSFGHGGDLLNFHAEMRLFPEQDLGLFVAYNSDTGAAAVGDLMRAFTAHYFPQTPPHLQPVPLAQRSDYGGWFAPLRFSNVTLARVALLLQAMPIGFDEQGFLLLPSPSGSRRYVRVQDDYFRRDDGTDALRFRRDAQGQVQQLYVSDAAMQTYARLAFLDRPPVNLLWVGVAVALLLLFIGARLVRMRAGIAAVRGSDRGSPAAHWSTFVLSVGAALQVAGLVGVALALADPEPVLFGELGAVRPALALVLAGCLLLPFACALRWYAHRRRVVDATGAPAHGFDAFWWLALIATLALTLWFGHWNLLGFHYAAHP